MGLPLIWQAYITPQNCGMPNWREYEMRMSQMNIISPTQHLSSISTLQPQQQEFEQATFAPLPTYFLIKRPFSDLSNI